MRVRVKYDISFFLICLSISVNLKAEMNVRVNQYSVESREPKISAFPCTKCHDNFTRQEVMTSTLRTKHSSLLLRHMPDGNNCSLCHNPSQTNKLNLLDGTLISYNESHRLCQQCHGNTAANWARGLHGRVSGSWNGERILLNCTTCHEAHDPQFKPMESVSAPIEPKFLIKKPKQHHEGH